jgi:hypothetical protein
LGVGRVVEPGSPIEILPAEKKASIFETVALSFLYEISFKKEDWPIFVLKRKQK